ncbi:NUDIX hydrolase [Cystobacter fuscus]|uniref:NUDIX hydrolase n=1 Tax=Cystobacter fuscus TaxID=43 RepID=A0A250J8S3_9BACT|nr:hypothetical protein [Cystobacter fuscus]ATB40319.1 NUDIX hydrolase [Cystobacter fuscus]
MSNGSAWQGNVKARLYERVRERGYDSLTAFKERADKAGDALLATPPPPGWRPLGPDDELLRTHLPDEEV